MKKRSSGADIQRLCDIASMMQDASKMNSSNTTPTALTSASSILERLYPEVCQLDRNLCGEEA
jgi:hypothetical protein